jgi:hypothetical protein
LNIIFGILLILLTLANGAALAILPLIGTMTERIEAAQEAQRKAQQEAYEKAVAEAEAAAQAEAAAEGTVPGDEAALDEGEPVMPAPPRPQISPFGPMMPQLEGLIAAFTNPWVVGHAIVDVITGVAINVAMIAAGVGLRRLRRWGRTLALWVAGLKIVRLLALQIFTLLVTGPIMAGAWGPAEVPVGTEAEATMKAMQTLNEFAMAGQVVLTIIVGSIYPIVCLWLLRREAVKMACQSSARPPAP